MYIIGWGGIRDWSDALPMLPLGEAGYALHLGAKAFKVTIYVRITR